MRRLPCLVAVLALLMTVSTVMAQPRAATEADLSGRWTGVWLGYGLFAIPRNETATAELRQVGGRGHGRLALEDSGAAAGVPLAFRLAGSTGAAVTFDVSGSDVVMTHALGGRYFTGDFKVFGDQMIGRVRGADPDVLITLTRLLPAAAMPAPVAVAAARTPAPPTPAPSAPVARTPEPAPTAAERPAPREFAAQPTVRPIHFDFDKADIRPDAAVILDEAASILNGSAGSSVSVGGHTDSVGTEAYNQGLSERRAMAVKDYLAGKGVDSSRLSAVGYGEANPIAANDTADGRALNRRVELSVN